MFVKKIIRFHLFSNPVTAAISRKRNLSKLFPLPPCAVFSVFSKRSQDFEEYVEESTPFMIVRDVTTLQTSIPKSAVRPSFSMVPNQMSSKSLSSFPAPQFPSNQVHSSVGVLIKSKFLPILDSDLPWIKKKKGNSFFIPYCFQRFEIPKSPSIASEMMLTPHLEKVSSMESFASGSQLESVCSFLLYFDWFIWYW
jgi:hypothetical protein